MHPIRLAFSLYDLLAAEDAPKKNCAAFGALPGPRCVEPIADGNWKYDLNVLRRSARGMVYEVRYAWIA